MKRFILALLMLPAMAYPDAAIFSGNSVKILKQNLNFNDIAYMLTGTEDPSIVPVRAPQGSMYMMVGASGGRVFVKTDSSIIATTNWSELGTGGAGSVTSVGLSLPSFITVTGSPVTGSGTLTGTLASQTANFVFAAPDSLAGAPTFRGLVSNDIPNLSAAKITSGTLPDARLSANVPLLNGTNAFTNKNTITVATTTKEALQLKTSDNSPTKNLLEALSSTNSVFASIRSDGSVAAATDLTTKFYTDGHLAGNQSSTGPPNNGDTWIYNSGTSQWEPTAPGSSGANTALSNLASTAVNTDVLPGTSGTHTLGNSSFHWLSLQLNSGLTGGLALNDVFQIQTGFTDANSPFGTGSSSDYRIRTVSGAGTSDISLYTVNVTGTTSGDINIGSGDNISSSGSQNSGAMQIRTGDLTNAGNSGNSADLTFATGTVAGAGTRGSLLHSALSTQLRPNGITPQVLRYYDSDASNYVGFKAGLTIPSDVTFTWPIVDGTGGQLMATDGAGGLTFVTAASSGATTALDNLASVAINSDLLPGADSTIAIGSTTNRFLRGNIINLYDVNDVTSVAIEDRILYDTAGATSIAWASRILLDSDGTSRAAWSTDGFIITGDDDSVAGLLKFGSADNTQYITFKAPDGLGTDYTVEWPGSQGAFGQTYVNDGSGVLTWGTPSIPLADSHILVGDGSNVAVDVALTGAININNTGVSTYAGTVPLNRGGTGQTTKAPAFNALSPMTTGGDLIYGGASGTGTRLANGTSGQFLRSNGGTTAPSWATITAANTTLSNLGSTAINASLNPDTDQTYNIGTTGGAWNEMYVNQLNKTDGVVAFSIFFRKLYDSAGVGALRFTSAERSLQDTSGNQAIEWGNRDLIDSSGNPAGNWQNRNLADTSGNHSVEWQSRTLVEPAGNPSLDWSSAARVTLGTVIRLYNLASDPGTASKGDCYFNTTTNKIKVYNGTAWETVTSL